MEVVIWLVTDSSVQRHRLKGEQEEQTIHNIKQTLNSGESRGLDFSESELEVLEGISLVLKGEN
jgi:hypothetical protein